MNAALRGAAASWQWQPPAGVADDWAGWSAAFRETFRKRYTFVEWESMVKTRQQLVGESAAQYALSKATLRQYCPHQMNEAEFVPYLINGIRHHQFAAVLVHSQLGTVQAFIETYSRLEAAIIHTPEIPDKHGKMIESLVAQNATLTAQVSELHKKMAFQHQGPIYQHPPPVRQVNWQDQRRPPGTSEDRQCYQCHQYGHLRRDCPTRNQNQSYYYRDQINPSPGPVMGTVEDSNGSIRPAMVKVKVENIEEGLIALVDPGATVNAIRRSLVSHLKIEETQTPPLRLADGSTSKEPIGEIVLSLCWEGKSEVVRFLVLEDPSHPIILGTNWIARVGAVVSLSEAGVMEAKTGGLRLSDLKKNIDEDTTDRMAACMMPEDEISLSQSLVEREAVAVPTKSPGSIKMSAAEETVEIENQAIVNHTHSVGPGEEWVTTKSLITQFEGEEIAEIEIATDPNKPTENFSCGLSPKSETAGCVSNLVGEMAEKFRDRRDAVVAVNTAKQDDTEATPFEIVYGRLAELLHERLKRKQQRAKARVDRKRKELRQQYTCPGDLVLITRTTRKPKLTKKPLPLYIGKYQRNHLNWLARKPADIIQVKKKKVTQSGRCSIKPDRFVARNSWKSYWSSCIILFLKCCFMILLLNTFHV